MTLSTPRRHHYLPQFYLAGFTPSGQKDDFLHVLDKETGKTWKSRPAGVAHQSDYYRLDEGAPDPFAFEKGLSQFEGEAAATLKAVLSQQCIPDFDHRVTLMNLIALSAIRVPSQRNILADAQRRLFQLTTQLMVSTPEAWEALKARAKAAGHEVGNIPYEEMRDFIMDESLYTIELSREGQILTTFKALDAIIPLLLNRKWSIAIAGEGAGNFICCDNPVARHWTIDKHPPIVPGFGLKHSYIVMPLDRKTALIGEWGGEEEVFETDRRGVAQLNSLVLAAADRFVFYPNEDTPWFTNDGRVTEAGALVEWYKARPKKRRLEQAP
jgi:hypothetical protein